MIQYSFELVDMGDEIIAVPIGDNSVSVGGVLKFNQQGAELFGLLQHNSVDRVIEMLTEKYDNALEEITLYVYEFIETLKLNNIWLD